MSRLEEIETRAAAASEGPWVPPNDTMADAVLVDIPWLCAELRESIWLVKQQAELIDSWHKKYEELAATEATKEFLDGKA